MDTIWLRNVQLSQHLPRLSLYITSSKPPWSQVPGTSAIEVKESLDSQYNQLVKTGLLSESGDVGSSICGLSGEPHSCPCQAFPCFSISLLLLRNSTLHHFHGIFRPHPLETDQIYSARLPLQFRSACSTSRHGVLPPRGFIARDAISPTTQEPLSSIIRLNSQFLYHLKPRRSLLS